MAIKTRSWPGLGNPCETTCLGVPAALKPLPRRSTPPPGAAPAGCCTTWARPLKSFSGGWPVVAQGWTGVAQNPRPQRKTPYDFHRKGLISLVPRERNGIRLRQHAGIKRKLFLPGVASSNFVPVDCTPMYHHHQAGSLWCIHQPQPTKHITRPRTTGNVHARVRVVVNG